MSVAKTGRQETGARLERFCRLLEDAGLNGAVLDRRDDQFYFTGYTGSDSVLVVAARKRKSWIVTDSRYTEEAGKTAGGAEVLNWKGGFGAFVGGLVRRLRMKKVAYTPHSMTAAFFDAMRSEAGAVERWQDADPDIGRLRSVKSRAEIAAVRAALACAEAAFLCAKKRWRAGMTEIDVKNDLEWEMRRGGAEDAAFETIVAVGANASLPHAHAGNGKIQPGKMILIDFGARVNRYNSDLTRTLWAGSVPVVWQKRYRAVLEAQQAGIGAILPGVSGSAVHAGAVRVFARNRLAGAFTHGLGHGVGLAVHEEPRLGGKAVRMLEIGNVVTVEPGVYFPGAGGIRVEDMVLVTKGGAEVLSSLPKDLESMVF